MKGTPVGKDQRRGHSVRAGVGAAVTTIALAGSAGLAHADRIPVTNKKPEGHGSLKAAIKKANRREGGDQITFAKSLNGKIDVADEVTLKGKVTIKGNGWGDPHSSDFRGLTLSGHRGESVIVVEETGNASLRELYMKGVSVRLSGNRLTVRDSYLDGQGTNDAIGISARHGEGLALRVLRTTVTGFDRGINAETEARIDRSTISDNIGEGGITVHRQADISNSTISGNVADSRTPASGGGIAVPYGEARVTNSTITGNHAISDNARGGGIYGDVNVINSTISSNRAAIGAGVSGGQFGDVDLSNSIVFGNTDFGGSAADCARGFTSNGGNLIGTPGDCLLDPSDRSGVDPLLGPLGDNGGPTETQALGEGSPAIGLAIPATATKFDQRGFKRGDDPDAGAYELNG